MNVNVDILQVKQRSISNDTTITLSGKSFTFDNVGDNDANVFIGDGTVAREVKAGEQFVIESIQNGYYLNQRFRILFTGTGTKNVLIWYSDYVKKSIC